MSDNQRTILHGDLDAFYASVAQRDNPPLSGQPVAVSFGGTRGVVSSCSYEARAFGVRSAMPIFQAQQLCSTLQVVQADFAAYHEASAAIHTIFHAITPHVEPIALDEAYLDVSQAAPTVEAGVELARRFKQQVRERTGLTLSLGVATNKLCAKIASGRSKPDGLLPVPAGGEADFLAPLSASEIWGIGPKTTLRLAAIGITTIGQIAQLDDAKAMELFGNWGPKLRDMARGLDSRPVVSERESKSISSETTLEHDLAPANLPAIAPILREQAEAVAVHLAREGLLTKCVGVKIRTRDFQLHGRQRTLLAATAKGEIIYKAAMACYRRWLDESATSGRRPSGVRLLGVKASSLITVDDPRQLGLFGLRFTNQRQP